MAVRNAAYSRPRKSKRQAMLVGDRQIEISLLQNTDFFTPGYRSGACKIHTLLTDNGIQFTRRRQDK